LEFKEFRGFRGAVGLCFLAICLSVYCSSTVTRKAFYEPITAELRAGNFSSAAAGVEAAKVDNKYGYKDRFLYYLDAGLAYHYAEEFDSSNIRLTEAERAAEELFTKSISKAALSVMLNDNALDYPGEDYEVLYSNLISALNYMAKDDFDGAFVEIRRANNRLNVLEDKYRKAARELEEGSYEDTARVRMKYEAERVRFNNDAFARYLSMHAYAAEGRYDDARIDREFIDAAFLEQPHIYDFPKPEVKYIPEDKDKVILSVVGLAGLSPVKEALNLRLRTDKDLDLVQIFYTDPEFGETEYGHLPMPVSEDFYFKFAIPQMVERGSIISEIKVYADSVYLGHLQLIEDVGAVAKETFRAKKSLIYLRTIARAVAKGLATHKLKKEADTGGLAGWLKKAAIDVATDISENADLRCSRLMPGRIYVGDFEILPGVYNFRVEFYNSQGVRLARTTVQEYKVLERGLNLIEAFSFN